MKCCRIQSIAGTTLILTLLVLSALSLMAAVAATRILPRLPLAYQNAAWEEARLGAEAGIDTAVNDLIRNMAGPNPNSWAGWQAPPGGPRPPAPALLPAVLAAPKKPKPPKKGKGAPPVPVSAVTQSSPIFVNNMNVSGAASIPTQVSIALWALQGTAGSHNLWYRIRSTSTCALPPMAYRSPEPLDPELRRLSLRAVRPSLQKEQIGLPSTIPLPNVQRTVEVLVEAILPFELALWTSNSMSLCSLGTWNVDSYDSTDTTKSSSGLYPGRGSSLVQTNGNVACGCPRPANSLYGSLIAANGASVQGAVATNGGDDPSTPVHENVSGTLGLDLTRIRDDFTRAMNPVPLPQGGTILPPPVDGNYVAGPPSAPTEYLVTGSLNALRITAPTGITGTTPQSLVVVMIGGDLNLTGPLIIPPTVTAVLYVNGNITFNNNVNAGPWSSNQPSQLLIFGEGTGPVHQRLQGIGAISVCAAFYAPNYDVTLDGDVTWCGSLAASNFQVISSGSGGIHYDEALGALGPPISFRIIRYVEDVRE